MIAVFHQCRLLLVLLMPVACHAFAVKSPKGRGNPLTGVFDEVLSKNPFRSTDDVRNGTAVLQQLNMSSSLEPKPFYARPQQWPALLTSSIPAVFRLGSGVFGEGYKVSIIGKDSSKYSVLTLGDKYQIAETSERGRTQQTEPLIIYEFEACPFCRKVREAVSMLSLTVTYKPCPKKGRQFRPEIKTKFGSRATFPFLVDPNTSIELFESDDMLSYLFKTYGNGVEVPWILSSSPLVPLTASVGLLARLGKGGTCEPSNPPTDPVVLWAYEGSPFCKLVREKLCSLEISHTQISCPRGSPNRQALFEKTGRFQVPYMTDPNTGVALFESEAILEYIQKQYGVALSPVKYI